MSARFGFLFFCLAIPATSIAQDTSLRPVVAKRQVSEEQANIAYLTSNTEVNLRLNHPVSTKTHKVGDRVRLSVTHDVLLDNYVVIPAGSPAFGEITWMTGKGMFGKSGKFDLEIRYIELNGQRVPVDGKFRQEGNGNTVATIGAVVVVPVAGFFVTGRSGEMPEGRELTVFTAQPIPVALPDPEPEPEPVPTPAPPPSSVEAVGPSESDTAGAIAPPPARED